MHKNNRRFNSEAENSSINIVDAKRRAKKNDALANYDVGECYWYGHGVIQSYAEAIKWYAEAAQLGLAVAQNDLGYCYEHGIGTSQNYEKAVEFYTKAAEQGLASAQTSLGFCYQYGIGVAQNYTKAVELYAEAAEQGFDIAQYNLGCCYEKGYGIRQNQRKAVALYTDAAEQGLADAQNNLGFCYQYGIGVAQNYTKAVELYAEAAEQGLACAQLNLGCCYGNGYGVRKDHHKAAELYTDAAEQGFAEAQYFLGCCYENGIGVSQNYTKAVELYTEAAEQGLASAQNSLGVCYANGYGVRKDYRKALELYREAAEQGEVNAQYQLGACYEVGDGVAQDNRQAIKWYKRAAEQGHKAAESRIVELIKMSRKNKEDFLPDIPKKGTIWELKHSWYILLTFLYPVSFLAFFFIGFRVNYRKWKLAGVYYMLLLLCPLITTKLVFVSVLAYFAAIIHSFTCQKEYLVRLDMYQTNLDKIKNQELHDSINQQHSSEQKRPDIVSKPLPAKSEASVSANDFVQKIRDLNVTITDETISRHLDNIELVLTDIFDYVEKNPEKQDSIRTLNNYYMPEVIKLLERYIELSNKSLRTPQMTAAMEEIESVLVTITDAFQNLYNSLFNDVTSEVSTNIKVLKDVLAQNGLTAGKNELNLSGKG